MTAGTALVATADQFRFQAKHLRDQLDTLLEAARRAEKALAQPTPNGLLEGSALYQLRRAIAEASAGLQVPPRQRLVITPYRDGAGFDVTDELGRCCDGLGWDEMLGQVAMLTIPLGRVGTGYAMHTPEEWRQLRSDQEQRWRKARQENAV